ncbi:hypothetical protein Asp14428_07630 [Actinoplanes sp. NBRC 14428]|nr:hypothetical protein Asp14428_07630 [Actinoplanes sp. NBRC 14428]
MIVTEVSDLGSSGRTWSSSRIVQKDEDTTPGQQFLEEERAGRETGRDAFGRHSQGPELMDQNRRRVQRGDVLPETLEVDVDQPVQEPAGVRPDPVPCQCCLADAGSAADDCHGARGPVRGQEAVEIGQLVITPDERRDRLGEPRGDAAELRHGRRPVPDPRSAAPAVHRPQEHRHDGAGDSGDRTDDGPQQARVHVPQGRK